MPESRLGRGYAATVVGLMLVLPLASILIERVANGRDDGPWIPLGRWFVFWAIGARLFSAGVRQCLRPGFTARDIFHLESPDAEIVIRELGFANICMGLMALISGFVPSWRAAAGLTGALYFGLAGVMHLRKRPATSNEWLALVSDLFVLVIVGVWLVHALAHGDLSCLSPR
jgi:hypothetical protein